MLRELLRLRGLLRYHLVPAVLGAVVLVAFTAAAEPGFQPFSRELPVPVLLEGRRAASGIVAYELNAQEGRSNFFDDVATETLGYNGAYLGPTLRVCRGDRVEITVNNGLDETTTVHWHGLHVPAEMDGGPHQQIPPGTAEHSTRWSFV